MDLYTNNKLKLLLIENQMKNNKTRNDHNQNHELNGNSLAFKDIKLNNCKDRIHEFHIPVMGTAFTIDTPYKVARFGISSVVSIGDDELCETMREYYSKIHGLNYEHISKETTIDYRAKRISAYLDLLDDLINAQIKEMKESPFTEDSDNSKFLICYQMIIQ